MSDAPIWFHIDLQLYFEKKDRLTIVSARRRCLGMVLEPARYFRKRFAQVFRDLFVSKTACFDSTIECSFRLSTSEEKSRPISPNRVRRSSTNPTTSSTCWSIILS